MWSNLIVGQAVIKFKDIVAWKLINWKHIERDWTKSNEMYQCLEWEGIDLSFIYYESICIIQTNFIIQTNYRMQTHNIWLSN